MGVDIDGYPPEFGRWFAEFSRAVKTAAPVIKSITASITAEGWAAGAEFTIEATVTRRSPDGTPVKRTIDMFATPDVILMDARIAAGQFLRIAGAVFGVNG